MNSGQLLLIFVRNLQKGRVKTRLATTVGHDKALAIYKELLLHTFEFAKSCPCTKRVCYSDYIEETDMWQNSGFEQDLQSGGDLGAKMYNAFATAFDGGYKEVILIGSDCMALDENLLSESFKQLQQHQHQAVLGPATDGGFYLIGLKSLANNFFLKKTWSHDKVFEEMQADLKQQGLIPHLLPTLSDIDVEQDWINHIK
jgi:rSAM/selenodomain-associated transferase 1